MRYRSALAVKFVGLVALSAVTPEAREDLSASAHAIVQRLDVGVHGTLCVAEAVTEVEDEDLAHTWGASLDAVAHTFDAPPPAHAEHSQACAPLAATRRFSSRFVAVRAPRGPPEIG